MEKFLKDFFELYFENRNDYGIADNADYQKELKHGIDIQSEFYKFAQSNMQKQRITSLLNDLSDSNYAMSRIYRYHDFKYDFITGLQLGIALSHQPNTNISADEIMKLLLMLKENNT